jgi:hypothetical protein
MFQQINKFINRKLEQYEEEQKRIEEDKAVVTPDILQKLKNRDPLTILEAIAAILTAILTFFLLLKAFAVL